MIIPPFPEILVCADGKKPGLAEGIGLSLYPDGRWVYGLTWAVHEAKWLLPWLPFLDLQRHKKLP
jgi:hypothetical protein